MIVAESKQATIENDGKQTDERVGGEKEMTTYRKKKEETSELADSIRRKGKKTAERQSKNLTNFCTFCILTTAIFPFVIAMFVGGVSLAHSRQFLFPNALFTVSSTAKKGREQQNGKR